MRRINDGLGVGHVVDGSDDTMTNADSFVDDLDHRSQAIRGAGSSSQQVVLVRPMAPTHNTDTEQRVIQLQFNCSGEYELCARAPNGW